MSNKNFLGSDPFAGGKPKDGKPGKSDKKLAAQPKAKRPIMPAAKAQPDQRAVKAAPQKAAPQKAAPKPSVPPPRKAAPQQKPAAAPQQKPAAAPQQKPAAAPQPKSAAAPQPTAAPAVVEARADVDRARVEAPSVEARAGVELPPPAPAPAPLERQLPITTAVDDEPTSPLPLAFFWKRYRDIAMRNRADTVDEFGRDEVVRDRVQPLFDFLYRSYFRVSAQGLGHVPDRGRALIVANHSGTLPYDAAMVMQAIRRDHPAGRDVRPLVEDFVFHAPYLGPLMNRIGAVRACPENAERLLERDELVAVFPEGEKGIGKLYRDRYQLQRFGRGGFVRLALQNDAPIIPTAIVGAEEIHPMLAKLSWFTRSVGIPYVPLTPTFPWLGPIGLLPLPSKWWIAFGEPLYYNAEYGPSGADDRVLVGRLAEQVRQRIQDMVDTLLKQRKSILFG